MLSGRWDTAALVVLKYMMKKMIYFLPHKLGTAIIWWRRETGWDNWKNAVWIHMKHVRDLNFILYYYSISAEKFSWRKSHIRYETKIH